MISKIEVALRARLIESLLVHKDPLILHDTSVFKDKKLYWINMAAICSEISRSKDVFIAHNFSNHEGEIPVWAAIEVLSFGTLSKIIKNLKSGEESALSFLVKQYGYISEKNKLVYPSRNMLSSWIQSIFFFY